MNVNSYAFVITLTLATVLSIAFNAYFGVEWYITPIAIFFGGMAILALEKVAEMAGAP